MQMTKPRKPRKGEDPNGIVLARGRRIKSPASAITMPGHRGRARSGRSRLPRLSDSEQQVWLLSNMINARGFHVDRALAEAARKIAQAAGPEINAEMAELTDGAVTSDQPGRLD